MKTQHQRPAVVLPVVLFTGTTAGAKRKREWKASMSEYWSDKEPAAVDGQLSLFDAPRVTRQESLQRSAEAKAAVRPAVVDRSSQAAQVLACIREAGPSGLTRHEIAERMRLPLSSVCGRVNELLREARPAVFIAAERRLGRSVVVCRGLGDL